MTKYKTDQEVFWAGEFGDDYTDRNVSDTVIAGNIALFQRALQHKTAPKSVIEFGANRGLNLLALKALLPAAAFTALEINSKAAKALSKIEHVTAIHTSILDYKPATAFDLVLIKGVLIHINPDELPGIYQKLYQTAGRYILIAEYYNPTPMAISYRGHNDRLFKRDFAGEMLDKYKDLSLIDYGFCYHRDPVFPLDDINWFLLEKR